MPQHDDPSSPNHGEQEVPTDIDSAAQSIRRLIEEAQAAAQSEIALARACATVITGAIKGISIWGITALLLVFVALLAFAIGALIALAQWTGAVLAALIVPSVLLLIAAIAGLRVRTNARRMSQAVAMLKS